MEPEELFSGTKWDILKELAKSSKSAAEIAKKTGQSTANVTIQLKLLEAQGVIKKAKPERQEAKRRPGKPKTPYTLAQEFVGVGILRAGLAEKKVTRLRDLDDFQKYLANTAALADPEEQYALVRLIIESELLKKADLIAYLKSEKNEVELFIVTETSLDEIRKNYSNYSAEVLSGKTKKIISWSHNKREVEEGLVGGEEYFKNLVRNSQELLDKKGLLEEWKRR